MRRPDPLISRVETARRGRFRWGTGPVAGRRGQNRHTILQTAPWGVRSCLLLKFNHAIGGLRTGPADTGLCYPKAL